MTPGLVYVRFKYARKYIRSGAACREMRLMPKEKRADGEIPWSTFRNGRFVRSHCRACRGWLWLKLELIQFHILGGRLCSGQE